MLFLKWCRSRWFFLLLMFFVGLAFTLVCVHVYGGGPYYPVVGLAVGIGSVYHTDRDDFRKSLE